MGFGTCPRCKGSGKRKGKTCRLCMGCGDAFKEEGKDSPSIYVNADTLKEIYKCKRICDEGYLDCDLHKECKRLKRLVEILTR